MPENLPPPEQEFSPYSTNDFERELAAFDAGQPMWREKFGEEIVITAFLNNLFMRLNPESFFAPDLKQCADVSAAATELGFTPELLAKLKVASPGKPYPEDVKEALVQLYIEMRKRGYSRVDLTS